MHPSGVWIPLQWKTATLSLLWSHTSHRASNYLKLFLALGGAGADPYSVNKGLLYSHMGWLIMKQNPKCIGRIDNSDLNEDPIAVWQHQNYLLVATFCVNLLAYWLGDQPFNASKSSQDHFSAILLAVCKRRIQQNRAILAEDASQLDWGVPHSRLPIPEWEEYVEQAETSGRCLIAIAGIVHDVTDFSKSHPDGLLMLKSVIGKDATAAFNGGVYTHSEVAHNLLATMRVASVRGGYEIEIWKHEHSDAEESSPTYQ
ncbi:cytochrome b5-like heme/steroid binding domain-containing protein [Aspergillus pseudotamarii]|uniref:Cytochrome b5-like heme/steroid binding domain-containing protein n=1 Tax=Aspergillus pseudotamarii TaxID=132259 RepID=A0A5N6T3K0_ASPPS|nr:cytochrome b5-like heme/steroid binding domain-containing protein [Aspergillus pseudotamarii]KAE8140884.1 cytochrome b5-like heme/steroid binding domain-containing protein [Aspergillus pseudotamarii]